VGGRLLVLWDDGNSGDVAKISRVVVRKGAYERQVGENEILTFLCVSNS
jgi:hypothetical protein